MERASFYSLFRSGLEELALDVAPHVLDSFHEYLLLLMKWSQSMNLTAVREPEKIVVRHFLESLLLVKLLGNARTLVDVGSGAGFPGVPLGLAIPGMSVKLVESAGKKANFLRQLVRELAMPNVDVFHGRVENMADSPDHRRSFERATSRAVALSRRTLDAVARLLVPDGEFLVLAAGADQAYLDRLGRSLQGVRLAVTGVEEPSLPFERKPRRVIRLAPVGN